MQRVAIMFQTGRELSSGSIFDIVDQTEIGLAWVAATA